jgi:hypothetical protein
VLFHGLEIAGIIALVYLVYRLFPGVLPKESYRDVLVVVLSLIAKFARVSPSVPMDDWVNKSQDSQ